MADRVKILSPPGLFTPTGKWSLGTRAGDFVFVAGMRGIDPATNKMVEGEEARVRQAFKNMAQIAASEGAALTDCVRLTVFVTEMARHRDITNKVQQELWSGGPYPPRSIIEIKALSQGDFFEVEGTFYAPVKR